VPWFWRHADPLWWVNRRDLPRVAGAAAGRVEGLLRRWRTDPERATVVAGQAARVRLRAFFGLG
jgi:hypothetical protein